MKSLEVKNVSHWFGSNKVLYRVNLDIDHGHIVAVVGPSGCGKSTLLRAILGTHPPNKGEVYADGVEITRPRRSVGIVYQDYSLYDFVTARENVAMGLRFDQTTLPSRIFKPIKHRKIRRHHLDQADAFLHKVGLGAAVNLLPREMSGGMRQRVAIAQAMILQPSILLLDEPFGALDEATREELQLMLLQLYKENLEQKHEGDTPSYTILIVTHELNEALYVSDRIVGLSQYHAAGTMGATVVYDANAPIFHPDDPRDFERFEAQKAEIRKVVFDEEYLQHHEEHLRFQRDRQDFVSGRHAVDLPK